MPKKKQPQTRKTVGFDNDLLEWFEEEYSGYSLWTLVNSLLRAFKEAHRINGRLAVLIKKAGRTTLENMNT